jgi:hypothetical protein
VLENNILYIANLSALEQWYIHVRRPFFETREFGLLILAGALENLRLAKEERVRRLRDMAGKIQASLGKEGTRPQASPGKEQFSKNFPSLERVLNGILNESAGNGERDRFLTALARRRDEGVANYIEFIQTLPREISSSGTQWLDSIVRTVCRQAADVLPALNLFKKTARPSVREAASEA